MRTGPVVIVLTSGCGERFAASGGTGFKPHARLDGCTALERTLVAVHASGLPWHLETATHPGLGDLIAAGVRATPGAAAWLILPGDVPLIQASTLRHIAQAPMSLDVVVPVVKGWQRGHPVRFSARCGPELMQLSGLKDGTAIMQGRDVTLWPVQDPGCMVDIDTLQGWQQARQMLAASKPLQQFG